MAKKKKKIQKPRDGNILASFRREVNLRGSRIPEKKIYSRKKKHKGHE